MEKALAHSTAQLAAAIQREAGMEGEYIRDIQTLIALYRSQCVMTTVVRLCILTKLNVVVASGKYPRSDSIVYQIAQILHGNVSVKRIGSWSIELLPDFPAGVWD